MKEATILIIDDDEDIVETLTLILTKEGYAVVAAPNGQTALDHLQAGLRPRLILLDFMMPVMNGWEFHERLMADPALRSIPIVAISGDGSIGRKAQEIGAAAWLRKPFALHELIETLHKFAGTPTGPVAPPAGA